MEPYIIDVGRTFSPFPYGRYPKHGPYNGEVFRDQFLLPKLKELPGHPIVVDFTNVQVKPGSSFLEETFGGLVRLRKCKPADLLPIISVRGFADPNMDQIIQHYISDAASVAA
jgi:hypothetical protein